MPIFKTKDENFFKKWTSEMAYVLGFFVADGCMFVNPRGSHYIDFTSTERELVEKVRKIMKSEHAIGIYNPINPNWKTRYRLQIGSKEIFQDLLNLGLTPNKSKKVKLPDIPNTHFRHFIRGYFDGDGCVDFGFYQKRGKKKANLITRFSSGNRRFLRDLLKHLKKYARIKGGCIISKTDKKGSDLQFSVKDSFKLYRFMYQGVGREQFLRRKYNKFQEALNYWGRSSIG